MGCQSSKQAAAINPNSFAYVDDSVHRMLEHDRKAAIKRGEQPAIGYVPRAPHPLLHPIVASEDDKTTEEGSSVGAPQSDDEYWKAESERLLFHAKHHFDTVDPRDRPSQYRVEHSTPQFSLVIQQ